MSEEACSSALSMVNPLCYLDETSAAGILSIIAVAALTQPIVGIVALGVFFCCIFFSWAFGGAVAAHSFGGLLLDALCHFFPALWDLVWCTCSCVWCIATTPLALLFWVWSVLAVMASHSMLPAKVQQPLLSVLFFPIFALNGVNLAEQTEIRANFSKMDADGNGQIDREEWIKEFGSDGGFDQADSDRDGSVDAFEFAVHQVKVRAARNASKIMSPKAVLDTIAEESVESMQIAATLGEDAPAVPLTEAPAVPQTEAPESPQSILGGLQNSIAAEARRRSLEGIEVEPAAAAAAMSVDF